MEPEGQYKRRLRVGDAGDDEIGRRCSHCRQESRHKPCKRSSQADTLHIALLTHSVTAQLFILEAQWKQAEDAGLLFFSASGQQISPAASAQAPVPRYKSHLGTDRAKISPWQKELPRMCVCDH